MWTWIIIGFVVGAIFGAALGGVTMGLITSGCINDLKRDVNYWREAFILASAKLASKG